MCTDTWKTEGMDLPIPFGPSLKSDSRHPTIRGMGDLDALDLEPGRLVGGYTLISRLGGGAMGSVWRARDGGGQDYAMKILRDSLADDENASGGEEAREKASARERLRREAQALQRVHHPGVCAIVDMELDDDVAFIVTELIEGRNLHDDVVANGRYVGDDLERLAGKMDDAVRAVHQAGIVHRDIKPTNVMISAHGPVLVDFGIAMGEGESHVTRTGLVMGTPGFIAPEIIDGEESDEATDWWSTAAVLAYAATGKPVFGSKPMMAVLERAASGNADLSGLPIRTMNAFRSALNPKREARCTPEALLEAISLDAEDPTLWRSFRQDETDGNDGAAALPAAQQDERGNDQVGQTHENDGKGAVRPFGASSSRSEPWGREDWRDDGPDRVPAGPENSPTQDLTAPAEAPTESLAKPGEGNTEALPPLSAPQGTDTETTQTLEPKTETLPSGTLPIETTLPWPTRSLPDQAAGPEAYDDGRQGEETAPLRAASPLPIASPLPGYRPQDLGQDSWLGDQAPAPEPEPAPEPAALIRRDVYLGRSLTVIILTALLLAALACIAPIPSLTAGGLAMWFLSAGGLGLDAQIARELKRGGRRKASDTALGLAATPWYLVKGLALSLPRFVISLLVAGLVTVAGTILADLPRVTGYVNFFGRLVTFPLPADRPASATGLVLAIAAGGGWLAAVLPGGTRKRDGWATALRLAAGWIPTGRIRDGDEGPESPSRTVPAPPATSAGHPVGGVPALRTRRVAIWAAIWLLVVVSIVTVMFLQAGTSWSPIGILYA